MEEIKKTNFMAAFQKGREARSCSYDPTANLETVDVETGGTRTYLGVQYKTLWFHTYCKEAGINGYIEADDFTILPFNDTAIAVCRAKVYLNDAVVGTGAASVGIKLGDVMSMNGAIQQASSIATGKALSAAGFGAVWSTENDQKPMDPLGAPVADSSLPFTFSGAENPVTPAPAPAAAQPVPAAAQPQDPNVAAKNVVWPYSGQKKGMTLGEILATDPKSILWIVERGQEGPVKEAAKLLAPEAKKACGK